MTDKLVCGWELPGYPIYICVLKPHGSEVYHEPKWHTNEVRRAIKVMREHGAAVYE